jgi:hypothetical protein
MSDPQQNTNETKEVVEMSVADNKTRNLPSKKTPSKKRQLVDNETKLDDECIATLKEFITTQDLCIATLKEFIATIRQYKLENDL